MANDSTTEPSSGKDCPCTKCSWRVPIIIIASAALAVAGIAWAGATERFDPAVTFLAMTSTLGLAAILLFGWLVLFSPLSPTARRWLGATGLIVIGLAAVFRIEGVSGDIVPTLGWRFALRADEKLPKALPAAAPSANLVDTTQNDYPGFLGRFRLATINNVELARDWSAQPPNALWRQPIGAGWSSFAVVGDFAVTQEQRGEEELITCYEVPTGKLVWSHATLVRFFEVIAGIGPRATPTIHEGKVYALGAMGHLTCLEGATGEQLWQHDIVNETRAVPPTWGKSCSPLIHENLVIVSAGGSRGKSLLAYDKHTGSLVWNGGDEPSSYSSPMVTTLAGQPQILIINAASIAAHDPSDGRVLWTHPWPGYDPGSPSCSQPLAVGDDRLLVSKGYGEGSLLLSISRRGDDWNTEELWRGRHLKTKFTNVVLRDGFAYALDEGVLECVEVTSGTQKWKRGKFGHGQVLLVGDLLLVQSETGDLALVEAQQNAYHEVARLPGAITGVCWNTPALSGRRLLLRSDEEAACYELPLAVP